MENVFVTISVYKTYRETVIDEYNEDIDAEELFTERQSIKIFKIRFHQDDVPGTRVDLEKEIEVEGLKRKIALKFHVAKQTQLDVTSDTWREWPLHVHFESYFVDSPLQTREFSFAGEVEGSRFGFVMSGKAFDKNDPFNINMLRYAIRLEFED